MLFLKRYVPLVICFVMGVAFAVQYYVPHAASEASFTTVNDWLIVIGGFSMVLGLASLVHMHAGKIKRQVAGWGYSAVLFIGIVGTLIAGIVSKGSILRPDMTTTSFGWIYDNMMVALQGTMFSILGFYVVSAAFRTFRARTLEAGFLLVAAIVVMFGHVPLGEFLWEKVFTPKLPVQIGGIADWIMNVPNMAAKRGIMLGVVLGIVAMSLKMIFGIERGYLGGRE